MWKGRTFVLGVAIFLMGCIAGIVAAWPVFIGTYITKLEMPAKPESVPRSYVWAADASVGYWIGCNSTSRFKYQCGIHEPGGKKLEDVLFEIDESTFNDIDPLIRYYTANEIHLDLRATRVNLD